MICFLNTNYLIYDLQFKNGYFNHMKKLKLIAVSAIALGLAACGSMNKIDAQGNIVNQDVKWGDIQKTTFKTNGDQPGMWLPKDHYKLLQKGMNKAQLYQLLGRPHYNEGFAGVREWNYVANFNAPDGGVKHCQLKLTFNKQMNVENIMWAPADCLNEPVLPPKKVEPQKFELRSDFLFDFDKSNLRPAGVSRLNEIVAEIQRKPYNEIVVVGHTDRLGSDSYNEALSRKRAVSVTEYLTGKGVPVDRIKAYGAGETAPVKDCAGEKATAELKACLEPNRRVEILVH